MPKTYTSDDLDTEKFREFVSRAAGEGYGSAMVPMFTGNTWPFDQAKEDGLIADYSVWIEVHIAQGEDQ